MPDHAKGIYRIYQALIEAEGFLFWSEFEKISAGALDIMNTGRKTTERIFDDMKSLNIVEPLYDFRGTRVVFTNEDWYKHKILKTETLYKRMRDLSYTQELLVDLSKWLERMNLAGWNSSYITDKTLEKSGYNGFYFDAISYTYLWGLYRTSQKDELYNPAKEKAGSPILIEAILHRETKRHDINGFITRVANVNGPIIHEKYYKIIPICFVDSIEKEALELARARGIMIITLTEVFGTKVVEALKAVRNIDITKMKPDKVRQVLEKLSDAGQDGKFGSLKGTLFNFLLSSVFSDYGFRPVIGKKYSDPENKERECECDIVITDNENIIICEVKGRQKSSQIELGESENDKDSVKRFFERTYNIVKNNEGKNVMPIFITSGDFTDNALQYLEKRNKGKKTQAFLAEYNFPEKIYYNHNDLLEFFSNREKYTEHRKILKEFFS